MNENQDEQLIGFLNELICIKKEFELEDRMNICCEVLGWKTADVIFVDDLINELEKYTKYNLDDVINEVKLNGLSIEDINAVIYEILYLNEQAIKEICCEYFPKHKTKIEKIESNIYCNYLDSGYDSKFSNWYWEEFENLDKSKKKQYIKRFLNNFGIKV